MQGDAALNKGILDSVFPGLGLSAEADVLVMPNLDAANTIFDVLKAVAGQGITVGPILLGAARPVHVLESTSTVRRITNMTALTVVEATMAA
jgi:malate dehydrogenase (oxaloacetate-decarboxylating)(NADP+)